MKQYKLELQAHFESMLQHKILFEIGNIPKFWEMYLSSFKKEDDPIFRDPNSSTHNCNICHSFIKRYANIVTIDQKTFKLITLFDFDTTVPEMKSVNKALSKYLHSFFISDVFIETYDMLNSLPYEKTNKKQEVFQLGTAYNFKIYNAEEAAKFGRVQENQQIRFDHLSLNIPKQFIHFGSESAESIKSSLRSDFEVFKRGMEEISLDTLMLVKDLINQGSLLNGTSYLEKLTKFIDLKQEYEKLKGKPKEVINWCWVKSYKLPFAKFKNELIGVLCSDLSQGIELNKACQDWNKRADPVNFMKAKAPITKKQIEEAKKFVEENGYEESFDRRTATIDDIKSTEILHLNAGDGSIKKVSIFDTVKSAPSQHKKSEFDKVEVVPIDKFMKDILPSCTNVYAFLQNHHEKNMVTLTTAKKDVSKPIFKWTNNYSWTYDGNLAGKSELKEAVKMAGGNVEGVLRFSLSWNHSTADNSDLDAWCEQPDGIRIGFPEGYRKDRGNRKTNCSGQLDLDVINPAGKLAIENIYFSDLNKLKTGVYKFWVNQFSARNSKGFKAEIEFDGQIFSYDYDKPVSGNVNVAKVTFKNNEFTIKHLLPCINDKFTSKEIYGLESNQFHKINLMCLSPNYWGENNVGNKHYFFMLSGCKNDKEIRSFHNENLNSDLLQHRKVLEVLGNQAMIKPEKNHLCGLGFNATVKDEVILKLEGTHKRVIKVQF